jgi:predicted nucleotidyltransferase
MVHSENTLRRYDPAWVIPAGTQVVLRAAKKLQERDEHRPPGSVGIVLSSPPNNQEPYLVRFADGATTLAMFDELTLRRREVDDMLGEVDEDLTQYIIYRCRVGSRAFGLAGDASDDDIRGVYLPPARLHWSLRKLPEQLENVGAGNDEVYWELEKYLLLALKANPNVLETLWTTHVLQANDIAQELRSLRKAFLSRHIYKTYSGYVLSQFRRMANAYEKTGRYKPKHAMHLLRLLLSGIEALRTHEIRVDVSEMRDDLLRVKSGEYTFDEIRHRALALDEDFQREFERTTLPEQPNVETVDAFLVKARKKMAE